MQRIQTTIGVCTGELPFAPSPMQNTRYFGRRRLFVRVRPCLSVSVQAAKHAMFWTAKPAKETQPQYIVSSFA